MAIKFTAKDETIPAKPGKAAAKAPAADPKAETSPAEETELFPAAPKSPTKKRKSRFS